jgi:hypothetical protein
VKSRPSHLGKKIPYIFQPAGSVDLKKFVTSSRENTAPVVMTGARVLS